MIKVIIKKNEIVISGHAGYEEKGKDIVCAAVSSTVLTTVNAILSFDEYAIRVTESDELKIRIAKETEIVVKLLNNMINMLKELEKDYKEYIKIIREG
ncbi:MAG: ribosomal-processing cysteine protease Prp [Tenericutes bacterium]|jgi:uncharacterized protein YsxB (DUF464 family)|nr:ribosomal-processing cysteine protease Prp [Bacilli bacterium]MDD4831735.1 ribosomal-processing cysteine protease Prp [Bacilli bacterium]NLV90474.1 ribosomal-processing cysteine protease Prp [Mycoplasmatota bacterium]